MVECLHVRGWKKRNRTFGSAVYNMEVLGFLATENHTRRLDLVQKFLWISPCFGTKCANSPRLKFSVSIYFTNNIYWKLLGQFNTGRLNAVQKSLWIVCWKCAKHRILLIPPDQNVSILFMNNMYIGNIRNVWQKKFYMKIWYTLNFSCLNFRTQNVLISPSCILLTSHGILHYAWSANLSKSFPQLCQYLSFLNIFSIDFSTGCVNINIFPLFFSTDFTSWFINFNLFFYPCCFLYHIKN